MSPRPIRSSLRYHGGAKPIDVARVIPALTTLPNKGRTSLTISDGAMSGRSEMRRLIRAPPLIRGPGREERVQARAAGRAALAAALLARRRPRPIPPKPIIMNSQVAGSGAVDTTESEIPPELSQ